MKLSNKENEVILWFIISLLTLLCLFDIDLHGNGDPGRIFGNIFMMTFYIGFGLWFSWSKRR